MKRLLLLFLLAPAAFAQSYSTTFPATESPISQGGTWLSGSAAGNTGCQPPGVVGQNCWNDVQTAGGIAHGVPPSTTCSGTNPPPITNCNDPTAVLNLSGVTWQQNQAACATVAFNVGGTTNRTSFGPEVEVRLHSTLSAHNINGYEFDYSARSSPAPYAAIVRWNGGLGDFLILTTNSSAPVLNAGDQVCATSVAGGGTQTLTMSVIHAGVRTVVSTTTDNTWTGGAPGIGFDSSGDTQANLNTYGYSAFTATNILANTCSIADITTAWATVTSSTLGFGIPSGTCDWSAGFHFTAPAGSTSLTIAGMGNTTGSDSLGNPTGYNDVTIAQINTGNTTPVQFTGSTSQTLLRVTGLSFSFITGTSSCSIVFSGGQTTALPTPFLRLDHTHWSYSGGAGVCLGETFGAVWGVVDHNVSSVPGPGVTNFFRVGAAYTGDGNSSGAFMWNKATAFGSNQFLFFENNFISGGFANDCTIGGKQVFRYNTLANTVEQAHELSGDHRGCRATEYYKNNVPCGPNSQTASSIRSGTMLNWGNTESNCTGQNIGINEDRTDGQHAFQPLPDWFYCGTEGAVGNVSSIGPSSWDGNADASGWPCVDQAGRGQGDYVFGSAFGFGDPMRANVTLKICPTNTLVVPNGQTVTCPAGYTIGNTSPGGGSWPRNALEPVYEWMDVRQADIGGSCFMCLPNRDYYQETRNQATQSNPTTPFNGTVNTGHGTLANRPTTCTAGPGGQFAAAPPAFGGSLGVAYWATDANGGIGELYVCNATNTWIPYYEPYTYPHPFVSGAGTVSVSPSSENFGSVVVGASSSTQTATLSNTTTASITITSVTTTGNTADFPNNSNSCSGTIAANGGTCAVVTHFTPTSTGARSANIAIVTSAGTFNVALSGTGTSAVNPGISIAPASIAFGNISVGTPSAGTTITMTSTTSANLVMGTPPATVTGTNAADFALVSVAGQCTNGQSIPQSSTCTERVVFTPSIAGAESAQVNIFDNVAGQPQVVPLTGTGVGTIALNPASLNFGTIAQGQTSVPQTVTVTNNTGIAPLALTGTSFTNLDFAATANTCNSGTLTNGQSCTVTITFRPSATTGTNETGFLLISYSGFPTSQVPLAGTVLPPIGAPAVNIFAKNLVDCGPVPKVTTFCFTGDGHIYVGLCNPTCAAFKPYALPVTGMAQ